MAEFGGMKGKTEIFIISQEGGEGDLNMENTIFFSIFEKLKNFY